MIQILIDLNQNQNNNTIHWVEPFCPPGYKTLTNYGLINYNCQPIVYKSENSAPKIESSTILSIYKYFVVEPI